MILPGATVATRDECAAIVIGYKWQEQHRCEISWYDSCLSDTSKVFDHTGFVLCFAQICFCNLRFEKKEKVTNLSTNISALTRNLGYFAFNVGRNYRNNESIYFFKAEK